MQQFPTTLILRHKKENLKKCSLRGLEPRSDFKFFTYPKQPLADPGKIILLTLGAPPLSMEDRHLGLLLVDGTWRYAEKMVDYVRGECSDIIERSIPPGWVTAYPREQTGCADPEAGLASVEALWIAYHLLGRDTTGLLDHYYWKEQFFTLNQKRILG